MDSKPRIWMMLLILATLVCFPLVAWSDPEISLQPEISIRIDAEKEVKIQRAGQTIVKRVQAETVEHGEVVFYTLIYTNQGNQRATDVVVNNPIPPGTVYLPESSYGQGCQIFYSIDKGRTFDRPEGLRVSYTLHNGKKMTRKAYASEYTHIRWVAGELAPGSSGVVGFQVSVK